MKGQRDCSRLSSEYNCVRFVHLLLVIVPLILFIELMGVLFAELVDLLSLLVGCVLELTLEVGLDVLNFVLELLYL